MMAMEEIERSEARGLGGFAPMKARPEAEIQIINMEAIGTRSLPCDPDWVHNQRMVFCKDLLDERRSNHCDIASTHETCKIYRINNSIFFSWISPLPLKTHYHSQRTAS
jgi:hypothetical protein